jgi:hypothetical protein
VLVVTSFESCLMVLVLGVVSFSVWGLSSCVDLLLWGESGS